MTSGLSLSDLQSLPECHLEALFEHFALTCSDLSIDEELLSFDHACDASRSRKSMLLRCRGQILSAERRPRS